MRSWIILIVLLLFILVNSQSVWAETALNGRFHYLFPVVKEVGSEDFSSKKAEFYVSADNFYAELDVYPTSPAASDLLKIDQAFVKVKVRGHQFKIGLMETGIGKLKYYSISTPMGIMDKEVEGMGISYNYNFITLGNFGNYAASETKNTVDRVLYAGIDAKEYLPVKACIWYTTDPLTQDSDLDVSLAFQYKILESVDLNANFRKTIINKITSTADYSAAGFSFNYNFSSKAGLYGSYSLGLNNETKVNNLENDVIFGISHNIIKNVKAVLEYQNSKKDQIQTKNDIYLAVEAKF